MKTIKFLMLFALIANTAWAQAYKMAIRPIDENELIYVEEKTNARTNRPLLKLDGTPHPGWQTFGFKGIGGYDPLYRAIKEVLTTQQIAVLAIKGEMLDIVSIFDLNGKVTEVCFRFYQENYNEVTKVITLDQFYQIAQKVKQYLKFTITEPPQDLDVQWLGGAAFIYFDKVRDWRP